MVKNGARLKLESTGNIDDHWKWQVRGKHSKIFFYSFYKLFERILKHRVEHYIVEFKII